MKRLLITAFEPFGGEKINPSWEAVERLAFKIGDYELTKMLLPVEYGRAAEQVIEQAEKINPDAILCIGQAGGRDAITPELVGINLRYAVVPDNSGYHPKDEPVIVGGENAVFSTLPVRKMAEAICSSGIPSRVSYSAGAYVCNDLLYTLLMRYKSAEVGVAFVHVPYILEQKKEPCMDINDIVKGLTVAIENM